MIEANFSIETVLFSSIRPETDNKYFNNCAYRYINNIYIYIYIYIYEHKGDYKVVVFFLDPNLRTDNSDLFCSTSMSYALNIFSPVCLASLWFVYFPFTCDPVLMSRYQHGIPKPTTACRLVQSIKMFRSRITSSRTRIL